MVRPWWECGRDCTVRFIKSRFIPHFSSFFHSELIQSHLNDAVDHVQPAHLPRPPSLWTIPGTAAPTVHVCD